MEKRLAEVLEEKLTAARESLEADFAARQKVLERQVKEANEQVEALQRQLYGKRSEKTAKMPPVAKPKKTASLQSHAAT